MTHVTGKVEERELGFEPTSQAGMTQQASADGTESNVLTDDVVVDLLREGLGRWDLGGRRVVCVVPGGTRTAPLPLVYRAVTDLLAGVATSVDWLIALGTHQPMSEAATVRHLGLGVREEGAAELARVHNHAWHDPDAFVTLGEISAAEVEEISGGLLQLPVPVRVNRRLLDCDVAIVIGPVSPHEVVGFSGGNNYLFPGLSGPELIDVSNWLGALLTASAIIGTQGVTPVRRLIDRAAAMIPVERRCAAMVIRPSDAAVHGLYLGSCEEAWGAAAALSAEVHIRVVDRPYEAVLAVAPPMYEDLWTAAKGVSTLEPVVADSGELVLYAPHVHSFSETHGEAIARAGYHCRDYFLAQPEQFAGIPLGVLAHGTRVRGLGTYDPAAGVESCRIAVTLATGISEAECHRHGLGWRDPASIDPVALADNDRVLVVERAGEVLHRLRGEQRT